MINATELRCAVQQRHTTAAELAFLIVQWVSQRACGTCVDVGQGSRVPGISPQAGKKWTAYDIVKTAMSSSDRTLKARVRACVCVYT